MITRRFFLAVRDTAKAEFYTWIKSDAQAAIRDTLRFYGRPFPITLVHQPTGAGAVAISAGVSEQEWMALKALGTRLPDEIKSKVAFSKGKSDTDPSAPTFDEWLTGLNLVRI